MSQNSASQFSLYLFVGIAVLLAIVELISAAIGFSMTGTVTGAVHNLYEGTLKIGHGDFSHRIPIAGGEHEFTLYGFRELVEARAVDYIQFDTNRVGGPTQARKIAALAEAHSIPVIPHAGQMHNYHVVMASLNSPMAEYFPPVDVEVGNELFWYIFKGEPQAKDGYINLDDNLPGLGLTVNEAALKNFEVLE